MCRSWQLAIAKLWWFAAVALGIACPSPLLITDVPPTLDYPNHLTCILVLAFAGSDPVLKHIYKASWGIIPSLAIDLVAPELLLLLPVNTVGRIMLAVGLLLPSIVALLRSSALFRECLAWLLAPALVASNLPSLLGFMNL